MRTPKLAYYGVTSVQVTLLVALAVLEYLSTYKAGVAQHLYFKKIAYIAHYYQGLALLFHAVLLLGMTAIVIRNWRNHGRQIGYRTWKYLALLTTFIICFCAPFFQALNSYAHTLIILELCLFLEFFSIISVSRNRVSAHS